MKVITDEIRTALLANGRRAAQGEDIDPLPVVKLFTPDTSATWLLTEADVDEPDLYFGLRDLGIGCPELAMVSFAELQEFRGATGMVVERDLRFVAHYPLSIYAQQAVAAGHITA